MKILRPRKAKHLTQGHTADWNVAWKKREREKERGRREKTNVNIKPLKYVTSYHHSISLLEDFPSKALPVELAVQLKKRR